MTTKNIGAFIGELLDRGVKLETADGMLTFDGLMRPSEIEYLREHKAEIVAVLEQMDEGVSRASFDAASVVGPPVVVRIEATFAKSGRVQFDLSVPELRFDEERFAEQVARLTDASWWRLDQPRTCADCRHAQPTAHSALVDCDQRTDQPACGYWWSTDPKMCSAWAPSANTHGQKASNK